MGCVQARLTSQNRSQLETMKARNGYQSSGKRRSSSRSSHSGPQETEREKPKEEKERSGKPKDKDKDIEKQKLGNKHYTIGHNAVAPEQLQVKEVEPSPRDRSPPVDMEEEQAAAGWPDWLTKIAGDALRGLTPRSVESYDKLDKIGQGTYSNVYKARDRDTGKIVALKKVRFDTSEPESVRFMAREIEILRRLDHPNVVKLLELATSRMRYSLYLVFEYMQSDLAAIISRADVKLTEPQVKCYMQQILQGLEHCHERGVLHRDIKGSNLLVDKDGTLKIADFGLATFFWPNQKQPLTNRVVTLWYRPPELLLGVTEYAVGVDLWSTGCLLAELFTGKPVMPGRTEVEQLHKIYKLCGSPSEDYWKKLKHPNTAMFKPQQPYKCNIAETFKDFPVSAVTLLSTLLAIEPADRGSASTVLKSEFFHTSPLACDPSSLPRFYHGKESESMMPHEGKRNKSGRLHKNRTRKHRLIRKKNDLNITEIVEGGSIISKQETITGMTHELKLTSDSGGPSINLDNAATSQNVMSPQQRSVASRMSSMNAIIKNMSPRTGLHPKGKRNVIPGRNNWHNEATSSAPSRPLTRDKRSLSASNFFANSTPNKDEQTAKLSSLADSRGETSKTEKNVA